ncbi:MAG TPA: restriction endonuclease, partial [Stellaceae bacterium]|nr:restriction endonuclease [Stellaceae bacterium]
MIRNEGGRFANEFIEKGLVSVGWDETGPLENLSRAQIIERVRAVWPDYKKMKAVTSGSQLDKIVNLIKSNDRVITYDPSKRLYHLGYIAEPYRYVPNAVEGAHQRPVTWQATIQRDKLSVPTKNSLGSALTIFKVPATAEKEIDALLTGEDTAPADHAEVYATTEADVDVRALLDDTRSKAREFIKDRIIALDWDEMQELVAGVLRAMGYKARISPPGSDRGRDIVASPDGLGLEQPRIVVEVKHQSNKQMGSQEIRSFVGGRHKDDRGLYISTGGFSKDAKYEGDRASIPLTLIDVDELVELVIDNYEKMDIDARTLLPLRVRLENRSMADAAQQEAA